MKALSDGFKQGLGGAMGVAIISTLFYDLVHVTLIGNKQ